MANKWVYLFSEGNANMRELLGGKGANLAEMTGLGLPVPQGFTITTEACTQYYEDGRQINDEIMAQIMEAITKMEGVTGKKFGDKENPLLVSVRSGARASMPGMMDTILNLGLNEDVVNVLAEKSGNARWAWDCYRRFIQMYSDVVMEVGKKYFEELIDEMKAKRGVKQDVELTAEDLHELAEQFKAEYKAKIGADFPTDPKEQLMGAIKAVFRSWDNPRANVYRRDNDIPYSWGTAVNVQDVYKRQLYRRVFCNPFRFQHGSNRFFVRLFQPYLKGNAAFTKRLAHKDVKPVSYTHLDRNRRNPAEVPGTFGKVPGNLIQKRQKEAAIMRPPSASQSVPF